MQRLGGRLLRSEIHLRKDQDWLSLQRLVYLYSCEKSLQHNKSLRKSCCRTISGQPHFSFSFPPKDVDGMAKGQESEDARRRLETEGWYLKHFRFVFMFVYQVSVASAETRVEHCTLELESQNGVWVLNIKPSISRRAASALNH